MTVLDPVGGADRSAPAGPLLKAVDVSRDYPSGDTVIHALRAVSLAADPGELVAVRGRSGSGKTTFLNILGGLDHPTSGTVVIDGHEVSAMSEDQLVDVRRRSVAFIFQSFGLVPILRNVLVIDFARDYSRNVRLSFAEPSRGDCQFCRQRRSEVEMLYHKKWGMASNVPVKVRANSATGT